MSGRTVEHGAADDVDRRVARVGDAAGVLRPDHEVCAVRVTTAPTDESLARIVGLMTRKLWSVLELHHRRSVDHDVVDLVAYKTGGRTELFVAALRREVVVIEVEPR